MNKKHWLIGAVILALTAAAGAAFYFTQTPNLPVAKLIEMANRSDPKALKIALKLAKKTQPSSRSDAAVVLGFCKDPQATTTLLSLASDPEQSVRTTALQIIVARDFEDKAGALKKLAEKERPTEEKLLLFSGMLRLNKDEPVLTQAIQAFLELGQTTPALNGSILRELISFAPAHPSTLAALEKAVKAHEPPTILPQAMELLARAKNPWLKSKLKELLQSPIVEVRMGAVDAISSYCPSDRWELLKKAATQEKSEAVLHALVRSLHQHTGKDALKVLSLVLEHHKIQDKVTDLAQQMQKQMANPPYFDICASKK